MSSAADNKSIADLNRVNTQLLRCAVYVRVSVADQQGSELTSIDFQLEACRAYIRSQQSLGWVVKEPPYVDDGVTGATLLRPGLRALLEDVRQDKVNVVIIHRLDRLSRSLFDLANLIPLFDIQKVALVSVSQDLDTQSPNGRLSLNLLTSFAQFEREIIGKRTRDKVAATGAKGMWHGSCTPLGYGVNFEQRLVILAQEAGLVRDIFSLYLSDDGMAGLIAYLKKFKVRNKIWHTRDGKKRGGEPLERTAVYRILNNRMYIGEAFYNGEWHSWVYPPIVDIDLWSQVHKKLAQHARRKEVPNETRSPLEFALIGKLFWHDGQRAYKFSKSSLRGDRHYLYYLAPATQEEKGTGTGPVNLPATAIHDIIVQHLRAQMKAPQTWIPSLVELAKDDSKLDEAVIARTLKRLDDAWPRFTPYLQAQTLSELVDRVTVTSDQLGIKVNFGAVIKLIRELIELSRPAKNANKSNKQK